MEGAAALHFTTEAERQEASDLGLHSPSFVLPLGVQPLGWIGSAGTRVPPSGGLRDPQNGTVFLFLSRLHPTKQLERLLEALALRLMDKGSSVEEAGVKGIFCGGTEFTQQWYRFAREELLGPNVYITPTYGNTLMGLACGKPHDPADNYKITYFAPQPRAVIEVVDFDDHTKLVDYGATGRVKLYTMTKELFVPGFLERDEGEREKPCDKYTWDGVSSVRPYHVFAKTTTVGVY